MEEAAKLPEYIQQATATVSQDIKPLAALLERVKSDYERFGVADLNERDRAKEVLIKQLDMVEWYVNKQQIVQALSVSREWLPSLLCYHFNLDAMDAEACSEMELLLRGGKDKDKEGNTVNESKFLTQWKEINKKKRKPLNKLWGGDFKLANLRNDVLHAGYRKNYSSAAYIQAQTEKIVELLKAIAVEWDILDESNFS